MLARSVRGLARICLHWTHSPICWISWGASTRRRDLPPRLPTLALLSTLFARVVLLVDAVGAGCVAAGAGAASCVALRDLAARPAGAVDAGTLVCADGVVRRLRAIAVIWFKCTD